MAKLKVTYKKSVIVILKIKRHSGSPGFEEAWHVHCHDDNPAIRGMIHKVRHLVEVEELD